VLNHPEVQRWLNGQPGQTGQPSQPAHGAGQEPYTGETRRLSVRHGAVRSDGEKRTVPPCLGRLSISDGRKCQIAGALLLVPTIADLWDYNFGATTSYQALFR
jgi:hypothetical protein